MSKIRVKVTRQLLDRLAAGDTLRFELPVVSDGVTSVEVEFVEDKTIFDRLENAVDKTINGMDTILDRVFGKSPFSKPSK